MVSPELVDGENKEFDTILFNNKTVSPSDCEVTETAWLLRPTLAKKVKGDSHQIWRIQIIQVTVTRL